MKKRPYISVIIPIYNAEKHLNECFDSIIDQTLRNVEIICINDGSTDRTQNIIDEYKNKDERIVCLFQNNRGASEARNRGIEISKGEYLSFIDADDYYPSKTTLETMYKKAKSKNALICGGSLMFEYNGKTSIDSNPKSSFLKETYINYEDYQWSYGFYRYIFNSAFIKKNKIKFPDLVYYEDPPFLLDSMIKARKFYAINEKTYCYRLEKKNKLYWTQKRIIDLARGILLCIKNAKKEKMFLEVSNHIKAINKDYLDIVINLLNSDNLDLKNQLIKINNEIDDEDFKKDPNYTDLDVELKQIILDNNVFIKYYKTKKHTTANHSTIGIVRSFYTCLKENGLKYTVKRLLFHLHLAKDNDVHRTFFVDSHERK